MKISFIKSYHASYLFLLFLFFSLSMLSVVHASQTNGTIPANSYAWGENLGWINLGCTNCTLSITDTGITGMAWSQVSGWINMSPTNGGVKNDGNGNLSGYAWSSGLGWIDFSGVTINSSGIFSGVTSSQNSPAGRINFSCTNCVVTTDWRSVGVRNGSGGNPGSGSTGSSFLGGSGSVLFAPSTTTASTTIVSDSRQPYPVNPDQNSIVNSPVQGHGATTSSSNDTGFTGESSPYATTSNPGDRGHQFNSGSASTLSQDDLSGLAVQNQHADIVKYSVYAGIVLLLILIFVVLRRFLL